MKTQILILRVSKPVISTQQNHNQIPKTFPKQLLPPGVKWMMGNFTILASLHIFSRINNYLPALRICLLINTQTPQQTSCMTTLLFLFFSFHVLLAVIPVIYLLCNCHTIILAIFRKDKLRTRKQIDIYYMTRSWLFFYFVCSSFCIRTEICS